jgi:hypothetical protein
MAGSERIVYFVPAEEKAWLQELIEESGAKTSIGLYRMLLDVYAKQIGFRPRPGSEKEQPNQ